MAFGVAISVKANLGISPISCTPYVLSLKYPLTLGTLTIIFNAVLILMQVLLLRKKYKLFQLIQLPVIFVLGFFIDIAMSLVSGIAVSNYLLRLLLCILSCVLVGIGVFIEVRAKVTYLPGEGLALAISETFNIEFGKVKIWIDCSMVVLGIICSFILMQSLQGIREGTIIAALSIGYIAKTFIRKIRFFQSIQV